MRIEKTLAILYLLGLICIYECWRGGILLLEISLPAIALLYCPGAFYFFCDKNIKRQNITLSIISGFFLSIIPISLLFKHFHWPGANLLLIVSIVIGLTFFAITYFLKSKAIDDLKSYYKNMFLRIGVLTALALFFYLMPTSTLLKVQYRHEPELARLKIQYYCNPPNEAYKKELDDYLLKRDSIQHGK